MGPFVNTMATDDKYSRRNVQNFQRQLLKALSQKTTDFSCDFYFFSQIDIKLEHFFKKDESPSLSISQIIDSERGGLLNV